jgi:EAL domain-containing protein (putative c-di-GMP-specific phosphodiesterase class I)/FixJ family two-component response regulator
MARLFIVDDDRFTCEMLSAACESLFDEVQMYDQAEEFLLLSLVPSDVVLLDLQMPGVDGIETIRRLGQSGCNAILILMSGYDAGVLRSADELARDYGLFVADDFTKPIEVSQLVKLLANLKQDFLDARAIQAVQSKFCDVALSHSVERFHPDIEDLRQAIAQQQLILYYQPQLDLSSGKLHGVEALVRWLHPQHGLLFPDDFIPLAEQSGLIEQLTRVVIDLAVKQSVKWQKQERNIRISINISAQNIANLTMPEQLRSLVQQHKLDSALLVFEVTESALMAEVVTSLDILIRLRLKGFELSIDDFGTGYSSLSQLHRVPFSELKIDKSFVIQMSNDSQSLAIVETCIMLGQKLNMAVVAEGIETRQSYDLLKNLGCNIGQGYFIAKPMAIADFEHWYVNDHQTSSLS